VQSIGRNHMPYIEVTVRARRRLC